jgi:hypothetical protein
VVDTRGEAVVAPLDELRHLEQCTNRAFVETHDVRDGGVGISLVLQDLRQFDLLLVAQLEAFGQAATLFAFGHYSPCFIL